VIAGNRAFIRLSAGYVSTCGIAADGVAYCWGGDSYGSLGNGGTPQDAQSPVAVDVSTLSGNTAFVQLSSGGIHACGLTADGLAYCWGRDNYGQLGNDGGATDIQSPSAVSPVPRVGSRQFARLVTGSFHACGLTTGGLAYCWGSDSSAQLGNGAELTGINRCRRRSMLPPSPATGLSGN
jgi:alpha-tubulin suppressor-like RCC1 family protein